ncbi:MAG: magnesium transporter [Verrucomicrobiaceae bacterium]|nr:magnesium transporter [Verrucomicrobiaceae bacterium]
MSDPADSLTENLARCAPHEAAALLSERPDEAVAAALLSVNPLMAQQILREFSDEKRCQVLAAAPIEKAHQWMHNQQYPQDSVGWLMEPPVAVFRPQMTVQQTIDALRYLTKKAFITYGYVTDGDNKLLGVLVMRDLMLGDPNKQLGDVMWPNVFTLRPDMDLIEAVRASMNRHFPVYPVCDDQHRLVGLVRGQNLFEARTIEIGAQVGAMMGVEKGERLTTPILRKLRLRHPWLQINLLVAFAAAAIVGMFQQTLDNVVLLAVFLPVLAGQSGNTGRQALVAVFRGITMGDIKEGEEGKLVMKEAVLGLLNGLLVGLTAGLSMWAYAAAKHHKHSLMLGLTVFVAMVASCVFSGLAGATIPFILRRFGTDPATASSTFLTTATDIVSMGFFLGLARWLVL